MVVVMIVSLFVCFCLLYFVVLCCYLLVVFFVFGLFVLPCTLLEFERLFEMFYALIFGL